jgi:hypothetical protein
MVIVLASEGRCCGEKEDGGTSKRRISARDSGLRSDLGKILNHENSYPARYAKEFRWKIFGQRFQRGTPSMSGVFENQDAAIIQRDLGCFSCRALVEPLGVWHFWFPGLVEPVYIRVVVGNPFIDRLPRRLDGLERLDVEGRFGWWRDVDDSLPEFVKTEEEFDLLRAFHGTCEFHGSLAAGALERIEV